jgi:cytochrome c-type biogenesis protein CcsB
MVAFAYLIKSHAQETRWWKLAPLWALGVVLCFEPLVFRKTPEGGLSNYWAVYFGVSALAAAGISAMRRRIAARLPAFEVLDDVMYKAIAVGFAFFTIATVLGALWAAEAWGGYWSWDPKETWALITWLVFAAYLHTRITKSWQGKGPAVVASFGFIVVWICYLGVNFLGKGLHSYGWIA